MGVLKGASRTPKRFLTTSKPWRQAGGWDPGNGYRAAGNAASTIDHFKAKTVPYLVLMRLVHFNEHIFFSLGCNLPARIDLGPVENAELVKTVLRRQQFVVST